MQVPLFLFLVSAGVAAQDDPVVLIRPTCTVGFEARFLDIRALIKAGAVARGVEEVNAVAEFEQEFAALAAQHLYDTTIFEDPEERGGIVHYRLSIVLLARQALANRTTKVSFQVTLEPDAAAWFETYEPTGPFFFDLWTDGMLSGTLPQVKEDIEKALGAMIKPSTPPPLGSEGSPLRTGRKRLFAECLSYVQLAEAFEFDAGVARNGKVQGRFDFSLRDLAAREGSELIVRGGVPDDLFGEVDFDWHRVNIEALGKEGKQIRAEDTSATVAASAQAGGEDALDNVTGVAAEAAIKTGDDEAFENKAFTSPNPLPTPTEAKTHKISVAALFAGHPYVAYRPHRSERR